MIFPEDYELEENFEAEEDEEDELPELMDYALDMSADPWELVTKNGRPVVVEGIDALRQWIKKALLTASGRYAYGAFGSKLSSLDPNTDLETMAQEAEDAIRETLEESDYIVAVDDFQAEWDGGSLKLGFCVHTIYGDDEEMTEVIAGERI